MSIWLIALILGLVEGITEFIPVSSTGHLLIAEHYLAAPEFFRGDFFNAVIQCGAVLAALPLFKDRLASLARWREPQVREYFLKLLVAFFITGVGGLVMKKAGLRLPESPVPVAIALLVGGVAFVAVERWLKGRSSTDTVSWAMAVAIGAAQLIAVAAPGASRSGMTILMALMLGLGRGPATEFSFLLGVPTLCAAGALTTLKAFKEHEVILWGPLVLACIVAAISSFAAVRWLLGYVRSHTFTGFGWYRIALGVVVLGLYFASGLH